MINKKIQQLAAKALQYMDGSRDPLHNTAHVKRVVSNIKKLCKNYNFTEEEKQALILAGYWHDVGRTITKKPSMLWMLMLDDLISALMLWRETLKNRLFGSVAGMSTRIIFCKSFGAGALFTRILIRKKTRLLLDILNDADDLDIIDIERFEIAARLSKTSLIYQYGFKMLVWWSLHSTTLKMKTHPARMYVAKKIKKLIAWIQQKPIYQWHIENFGIKWTKNTLKKFKQLHLTIILSVDIMKLKQTAYDE